MSSLAIGELPPAAMMDRLGEAPCSVSSSGSIFLPRPLNLSAVHIPALAAVSSLARASPYPSRGDVPGAIVLAAAAAADRLFSSASSTETTICVA